LLTDSSRSLSRGLRTGALLLLSLAACGAVAPCSESVKLKLVPAREELFREEMEAPNAAPGEDQVLVFGRFDDARFRVANTGQITVIAPDGRQVPLTIEKTSVFFEFDRVVSLRFFFAADRKDIEAGAGSFEIRWGPDVKTGNRQVERIALDPGRRDDCREFRWFRPKKTADDPDSQVTTVTVIADSYADYYFMWYLVPMALIFVLLTIRKIRARDSADRPAA